MRKAARPSGDVDSSNQHRWRGKQLCHHGDGVWKVVSAFCAVSQLVTHKSGSTYVKNVPQHNLKMRLNCYFLSHTGVHHTCLHDEWNSHSIQRLSCVALHACSWCRTWCTHLDPLNFMCYSHHEKDGDQTRTKHQAHTMDRGNYWSTPNFKHNYGIQSSEQTVLWAR